MRPHLSSPPTGRRNRECAPFQVLWSIVRVLQLHTHSLPTSLPPPSSLHPPPLWAQPPGNCSSSARHLDRRARRPAWTDGCSCRQRQRVTLRLLLASSLSRRHRRRRAAYAPCCSDNNSFPAATATAAGAGPTAAAAIRSNLTAPAAPAAASAPARAALHHGTPSDAGTPSSSTASSTVLVRHPSVPDHRLVPHPAHLRPSSLPFRLRSICNYHPEHSAPRPASFVNVAFSAAADSFP